MGLIDKLFGTRRPIDEEALYAAVVAEARQPHWYVDGKVPDTMNGRFDMIAAVLAMVLLRLEADPSVALVSARLTECFITDMDGQLRENGVGDVGIGKNVGQMMSMLGGRIGAFRSALADGMMLRAVVQRNLYRGIDPGEGAFTHCEKALLSLRDRLAALPTQAVVDGSIA